jgi:hypothetical protein
MWLRLALCLITVSPAALTSAISLYEIDAADVIVVGRVSSSEPVLCDLDVLSPDGELIQTDRHFAVYAVRDVVALKGEAPTSIGVLARPPEQPRVPGAPEISPLPRGHRVLILLQKPAAGRFRADQLTYSREFVAVPGGADFAFFDIRFSGARIILPDAPADLGLKHDYVARDVARVLALSTELPPEYAKRLPADYGLKQLALDPSVHSFSKLRGGPYEHLPSLVGPEPFEFFAAEISPELPPITGDTPVATTLASLLVAGTWGDPEAADQTATIILSLGKPSDAKLAQTIAAYAGSVGSAYGGDAAAARLLASPDPGVVKAAVQVLASPSVREYRDAVKALLDREEPEILREVMRSLAQMDMDLEHYPVFSGDKGFEEGSHNAEMLEYWRNKP